MNDAKQYVCVVGVRWFSTSWFFFMPFIVAATHNLYQYVWGCIRCSCSSWRVLSNHVLHLYVCAHVEWEIRLCIWDNFQNFKRHINARCVYFLCMGYWTKSRQWPFTSRRYLQLTGDKTAVCSGPGRLGVLPLVWAELQSIILSTRHIMLLMPRQWII